MVSLIDKLMMYIFGTVRMSLLNMIMMRMVTMLVVPNINGIVNNSTWYFVINSELIVSKYVSF
jgi:hypothetical protein